MMRMFVLMALCFIQQVCFLKGAADANYVSYLYNNPGMCAMVPQWYLYNNPGMCVMVPQWYLYNNPGMCAMIPQWVAAEWGLQRGRNVTIPLHRTLVNYNWRCAKLWIKYIMHCTPRIRHFSKIFFYFYCSRRSHLIVWSLWQTQSSSSQIHHGLHLVLFRWLSWLGWHSPSISASVPLFFVFQMAPSTCTFFRRFNGIAPSRVRTSSVSISCSVMCCSLP